jgi:D-cysteine desulfhydrase
VEGPEAKAQSRDRSRRGSRTLGLAEGWTPEALDALPRLGWIERATPVQPLPELAQQLGLEWLGVKRDDLCGVFPGGSKVRKLDFLLASEPFAQARAWASVGAIGSGHLVALAAAAQRLGRQLDAYLFWVPPSAGVLENLAFTASGAARLVYRPSRMALFLRYPQVWIGSKVQGRLCIPPGGSCAAGMLGLVRAGLELAQQVRAGELPEPQRLYVALGSGGTAAGLALGLALGGLGTVVHAVAVVERLVSPRRRVLGLVQEVRRRLASAQLPGLDALEPARIVIDRSWLGPGYGHATAEALEARDRLWPHGLELEPLYTGKAMSALLADAKSRGCARVLFWHTARGPLPPPPDASWHDRLPPALARRLGSMPPRPASWSARGLSGR